MAVKWNFKDIGRRLRPEAILDVFKGGDTSKKMQRRLVNSMVSGGTGYLTGGPIGGLAGGIWGYNEGNEPLTGRNVGQNALRGLLAGGAAKGLTSAAGRLGAGSAGSGVAGSGGSGVAGSTGAGGNVVTSASGKATATPLWKTLLKNSLTMNRSGNQGMSDEEQQQLMFQQWLNDMRKKREIEAMERRNRQQTLGGY